MWLLHKGQIHVSAGVCLLLGWFVLVNGWRLAGLVLSAAALHELGHYVVLRLLLWTGSGMRNRIFALVHLHHEDWKEEVSIYKRGIRDGKKFLKEKQR